MRACDEMNCGKRKICRVYEMIQQFKNEIQIDVNLCLYHGQMFVPATGINNNTSANVVSPKIRSADEVNDISARIHALQEESKSTSPKTTAKAKAGHMQFSVDDHDVN